MDSESVGDSDGETGDFDRGAGIFGNLGEMIIPEVEESLEDLLEGPLEGPNEGAGDFQTVKCFA